MRHAAVIAILACLLFAGLAEGAAQTREGYVEAVEPICRANTKANERILVRVRREVARNELSLASSRFAAATAALRGTLGELKAVPPPPGDTARLGRWFEDIEAEVSLFSRTATELRTGDKSAAERMSAKLTGAANRANDEVLPFEFRYCHAEPSRFI